MPVCTLSVGCVGVAVSLVPDAWARLFTSEPQVLAAARSYFAWAGPAYPLFGLGLCLYFASQGSGKILGPVIAGTLRFVVVAIGGWWLTTWSAPVWTIFALVGFGMATYGLGTAAAVHFVSWEPKLPVI